jgi:hypothetical protein
MLASIIMLVTDTGDDNQLAVRLRDYLQSTLHLRLDLKPWKGSSDLFLAREFEFRQAHILSIPCPSTCNFKTMQMSASRAQPDT